MRSLGNRALFSLMADGAAADVAAEPEEGGRQPEVDRLRALKAQRAVLKMQLKQAAREVKLEARCGIFFSSCSW